MQSKVQSGEDVSGRAADRTCRLRGRASQLAGLSGWQGARACVCECEESREKREAKFTPPALYLQQPTARRDAAS